VGLKRLGLDEELLRHGIIREVYAMALAPDFRDFLCDRISESSLDRPTAAEIATVALERWVLSRAQRMPEYRTFKREQILELIQGKPWIVLSLIVSGEKGKPSRIF